MFEPVAHDLFSDENLFHFEPWEIDEEPIDFADCRAGADWVIQFPNARSVGVVMLKVENGEWVDHAPAYGRVEIPDGAEIGIRWDASAPVDKELLARLPAGSVTKLDFEWSDLADKNLGSLLRFDRLGELRLGHTRVTDAGMATVGVMTSLKSISLRGLAVTDDGAAHLVSLPALQEADLAATRITDATLELIGRSKTLERLDVSANPWPRITGRGLESLSRCRKLAWLSVAWSDLSDMHLAPIGILKSLKGLDLSGTRVTDIGLRLMERLPLERLTLCATPGVTNVGMSGLRRMETLKSLELHQTCVDNVGVFDLWTAKPKCAINGITQPQWQAGALRGRWSSGEPILGAAA